MSSAKLIILTFLMIFDQFANAAEQKVRFEKNINNTQVFDVLKQYTPIATDNFPIVTQYLNNWRLQATFIYNRQNNYHLGANTEIKDEAKSILHTTDGRIIVVGDSLLQIWQEIKPNQWKCIFFRGILSEIKPKYKSVAFVEDHFFLNVKKLFEFKNKIFIHNFYGIYELQGNKLISKINDIDGISLLNDSIALTNHKDNLIYFFDENFNLVKTLERMPLTNKVVEFQDYLVNLDTLGDMYFNDKNNKENQEYTKKSFDSETLFVFQNKLICLDKKRTKLVAITDLNTEPFKISFIDNQKNHAKINKVYKVDETALAVLTESSILFLIWNNNNFNIVDEIFVPDANLIIDIAFMNDGRIAVLYKNCRVDIYSNEGPEMQQQHAKEIIVDQDNLEDLESKQNGCCVVQ